MGPSCRRIIRAPGSSHVSLRRLARISHRGDGDDGVHVSTPRVTTHGFQTKRPCALTRHSFRAGSASDRCSTPRWHLGLGSSEIPGLFCSSGGSAVCENCGLKPAVRPRRSSLGSAPVAGHVFRHCAPPCSGNPDHCRGIGAPGVGYRSASSERSRGKPSRSTCRTMLVDSCSSVLSSWAS